MYNKSFNDTIDMIIDHIPAISIYLEDLFGRLKDDDDYDVFYCLQNNISPDLEKFPRFEEFLDHVYEKCRNNIYYFLRNIIRLPMQGGGFMNFQINIGTLSLIEHYVHQNSALLENPRQTFQSTTMSCIAEYESLFNMHNAEVMFLDRHTTRQYSLKYKTKIIDNQIPSSFKHYVEKRLSDPSARPTFSQNKRLVFIDDFEFHESLKSILSIPKVNYEGDIVYYATSTVNGELDEKEVKYIKSITIDNVNNFNIMPLAVPFPLTERITRIWYDASYFFTEEECKEWLEQLGLVMYKHEILRIR